MGKKILPTLFGSIFLVLVMTCVMLAPSSAKPPSQGKLTVSMTFMEFTPDPMLTRNTQKPFMDLIFDYLVGKTPEAKLNPDRGIAKKWEASPDVKTHTFYLRKGVKFHNGEELTGEDVKFSIERVVGPKSVSGYASSLRPYIDKIEVPDPYKVIIHTKKPAPDLPLLLSAVMGPDGAIIPKKYVEEKGDNYFVKHPIGSGPYKVKEIMVGSHIELEAVAKHWRVGVPKYKTILLKHVTEESTRVAQLVRGEVDIIAVGRERAPEVEKAGFNLFVKPDATLVSAFLFEMWDKDSPLADIRVREALTLAINREELTQTLFVGMGKPSHLAAVGSLEATFDPKLFPVRPYDPKRAKALLAEVGYRPRIKLYSYPRSGIPEIGPLAEAVASYWTDIGVKVEIVRMDYGSFRKLWKQGKLGGGGIGATSIHSSGGRVWRYPSALKIYHSSGTLAMTKSPEVDRVLEDVLEEVEWEKAVQRAQTWHKYKYDNFLAIGLVDLGMILATSKDIKQWELGLDEYGLGWDSLITRR